ncbi:MAG TPA: DUF2085 domain-containing protein [Candidatus Woesebacteria bacterium]|nr:DUF2085 domain-containing protein [Candidatus Woesebacteria bacterium]
MEEDTTERKLLLGVVIFFSIFTLLPIIAPIAAHFGLNFIADPIYWIYQWFCHQRPWRSYHLFDYQLAMDARMMLMFASMAIGGLIIYLKRIKPLKPIYAIFFAFLFIIPLGLDGTIQAIAELSSNAGKLPFYESTNLTRSLTGSIFGIGVAFGLFPFLNGQKGNAQLKNYVTPVILTLLSSILFIFVLVSGWSLTSSKYKPSHFFIDFEQKFPGYNYEITTSAGHSTIERVLNINDEKLYLERAKAFDKKEYIEDYLLKKQND